MSPRSLVTGPACALAIPSMAVPPVAAEEPPRRRYAEGTVDDLATERGGVPGRPRP